MLPSSTDELGRDRASGRAASAPLRYAERTGMAAGGKSQGRHNLAAKQRIKYQRLETRGRMTFIDLYTTLTPLIVLCMRYFGNKISKRNTLRDFDRFTQRKYRIAANFVPRSSQNSTSQGIDRQRRCLQIDKTRRISAILKRLAIP
jgi:hypothetical protein